MGVVPKKYKSGTAYLPPYQPYKNSRIDSNTNGVITVSQYHGKSQTRHSIYHIL